MSKLGAPCTIAPTDGPLLFCARVRLAGRVQLLRQFDFSVMRCGRIRLSDILPNGFREGDPLSASNGLQPALLEPVVTARFTGLRVAGVVPEADRFRGKELNSERLIGTGAIVAERFGCWRRWSLLLSSSSPVLITAVGIVVTHDASVLDRVWAPA